MAGDAVTDLAAGVSRLPGGHPVLTTTWVLELPEPEGQEAFLRAAEAIGAERDLSMVSYVEPDMTPGLGWPQALSTSQLSVLRITRWRSARRNRSVRARRPSARLLDPVVGLIRLAAVATQHFAEPLGCGNDGGRVQPTGLPGEALDRADTLTAAITLPLGERDRGRHDATPGSRSATECASPASHGRQRHRRERRTLQAALNAIRVLPTPAVPGAAEPALMVSWVPTGIVSRKPTGRSAAAAHTRMSPWRRRAELTRR